MYTYMHTHMYTYTHVCISLSLSLSLFCVFVIVCCVYMCGCLLNFIIISMYYVFVDCMFLFYC